MSIRALALAPIVIAGLAGSVYAQAPGEWTPPPGDAPAQPAPPPARMCGLWAPSPVMATRWSIGVGIGTLAVAPKDSPDDKAQFPVGELALRFRATPHLELELSALAGTQRLDDGSQGNLEVRSAMLAARYHFNPEDRWNWFVLAGVGGTSLTKTGATDQQRSDATQPSGEVGIGMERRFNHFAIEAQLRGLVVSAPKTDASPTASPPPLMPEPGASTGLPMQPKPTQVVTQEQHGAVVTIGLSYYF